MVHMASSWRGMRQRASIRNALRKTIVDEDALVAISILTQSCIRVWHEVEHQPEPNEEGVVPYPFRVTVRKYREGAFVRLVRVQ